MQLPWKQSQVSCITQNLQPLTSALVSLEERVLSGESFLCFRESAVHNRPCKSVCFFFSMPNNFHVPEVVYLAILFTKFTKSKGLSRLFTQCCWSPLFTESHYCLCQQRPCFSAGGAWTWEIEIQGHALSCCYKYAAWREGKKKSTRVRTGSKERNVEKHNGCSLMSSWG